MIEKALKASLVRILVPLVRLLLRYGLPYGAFAEIAKRVYVEVALKEFTIPGRKPTNSRASVITGLSRKEILRVQRFPELEDEMGEDLPANSYNRAIRVISGWVRDPEFSDDDGQPAVLAFEGETSGFSQLVRRYSGDTTPRAVLDELLRVGSVEQNDEGKIRLLSRSYVPADGDAEKISILGNDVADLIQTIDHNLQGTPENSRFQLKVYYDNLPAESIAPFRSLSTKQSRELLEFFDRELSSKDRDTNPKSQGTGQYRAGVSIYYFEEDMLKQNPEEENDE